VNAAPYIGDEIVWDSVPDGALVREIGGPHNNDYTLKLNGRGWLAFAQMAGVWRTAESAGTPWDEIADHSPTVIVVALDLTAEVRASYLEQRAGIFEIWTKLEADSLPQRIVYEHETIVLPDALYVEVAAMGDDGWMVAVAAHLYKLGFRANMYADDAVVLLKGGGK